MSGRGGQVRRWRLGVVGTVLLVLTALVAGIGLTGPLFDPSSGRVAEAATDLAGWRGVELTGTVTDERGDHTRVELTVTADGVARGTLGRDFGAGAEFVASGTRTLLKGNAAWWVAARPGSAHDLADVWVEDPPRDATGLVPIELLTPHGLAEILRVPGGRWAETGEHDVAGQPGTELFDGQRLAVVHAGTPARLLALDVPFEAARPVAPRAFTAGAADEPEFGRLVPAARFSVSEPTGSDLELLRDAVGLIEEEFTGRGKRVSRAARDLVADSGAYGPDVLAVFDKLTKDDGRSVDERLTEAQAWEVINDAANLQQFAPLHELVLCGKLHRLSDLLKFSRKQLRGTDNVGGVRHLQAAARYCSDETVREIVLDGHYPGKEQQDQQQAGIPPAERTYTKSDFTLIHVDDSVTVEELKTVTSQKRSAARQALQEPLEGFAGGNRHELPLDGAKKRITVSWERTAYEGLGVKGRTGLLETIMNDLDLPGMVRETGAQIDELVVLNEARLAENSPHQKQFTFTPRDWGGNGTPAGTGTPKNPPSPSGPGGASTAPEASARPAPSGATEAAEESGPGLFGGTGDTASSGALADAALDPGGIDLTTLELRYLAEPEPGEGLQYAFSAAQAGAHNPADPDLRTAALASDAFFTWLALDPQTFFVNLHPDEPERIVDPQLGRTDAGRVLLEADLQMKKTVAGIVRPDNPAADQYWNRLKRSPDGASCVPAQRHWIVPRPATVHTDRDQLYILDAPLEVRVDFNTQASIETDCPGQPADVREYNIGVYESVVLPQLQHAIDTGPEYADLRRVHLSRVAAEWYRQRAGQQETTYGSLIDSGDITAWQSEQAWSPRGIYDAYLVSLTQGEYNITRNEIIDGIEYEVSYAYGGVELATVALQELGRDEFAARYPDLAAGAEASLGQPSPAGSGQVLLGSRTPAPAPSGPVAPQPLDLEVLIRLGVEVVLRQGRELLGG